MHNLKILPTNFKEDITGKIFIKGYPGFNTWPYPFKIFLNDIFYFIKNSDLYNYADDNALSYSDHDINKVISTLEDDQCDFN
jgi:hypothetical protein